MRCTSGYASICCILLHQLLPRDMMAPITRGMPNGFERNTTSDRLNHLNFATTYGNVTLSLTRVDDSNSYENQFSDVISDELSIDRSY